MENERFFCDSKLPFIECRYSKNSGKHYKPHIHSTLSIGAIDNGEVIYSVAGKKSSLKPGELAVINPNALHFCNPMEKASRSYYMLYLDTSWCLKIQQSFCKTDSFLIPHKIILKNQKLYDKYIKSMNLFMQKGFLLEKEQMMAELVEKIFKESISYEDAMSENLPLHIEKIKDILSNNLDEEITLEDISKKLRINPYTLLRNFKESIGITPHAYRMNLRIELAKKLLKDGKIISEIALECGFCDQSHLNRHFKAMTIVTPKEYQNNFIL